MSGQRGRDSRTASAAALLLAMLAVACSQEDPKPARPVATASPSALSDEDVFLEEREQPKVEAAWERFATAYDAGDWDALLDLTTAEGRDYVEELRAAVDVAGPAEIREMDTYRRVAIAVLRAAGGRGGTGRGTEGFVATLGSFELIGSDAGGMRELPIGPIQVLGDKALTRIAQSPTAAWEIDFELEGGEWKVDLGDVLYMGGDALEAVAERRGVPLDRVILAVASRATGERVTPEIWERPNR